MKNTAPVIAAIVLIFSISLFAQKDSSNVLLLNKLAESYAVKLQQKILLSDVQTSKIKSFLSSFVKGDISAGENIKSLQAQIENVLDKKQKAKYQIIRNEWWNNFLNSLSKNGAK